MNQTTELPFDSILFEELISLMWKASDAILEVYHSGELDTKIKGFLKDFGFEILPLSEKVGYRASIYVEEYALSHGTRVADALVAATAVEENLALLSGNVKHFKSIKDLQLKQFRP